MTMLGAFFAALESRSVTPNPTPNWGGIGSGEAETIEGITESITIRATVTDYLSNMAPTVGIFLFVNGSPADTESPAGTNVYVEATVAPGDSVYFDASGGGPPGWGASFDFVITNQSDGLAVLDTIPVSLGAPF